MRSPWVSAKYIEMLAISANRSRSGASEAMAPSRNTMFLMNSMSSFGSLAP